MITQYFVDRGLKITEEVTDKRFQMVDDGGVEVETGEFLYGMIRRLKPIHVLTTGIYTGVSDMYIAKALIDNKQGDMTAIEYEKFHIDRAHTLWEKMGVSAVITPILSDSLKYTPNTHFQFMFLDTEPYLRFKELVRYFAYLDEGGYIFVHDMPRSLCQGNKNPDHPDFKHWPVGELPEAFDMLLKTKQIVPFYFSGARGLAGYYKVHKEDYV